jgi:hypothetical protein
MSKYLKVKKERVLETAKQCDDVKRILKGIFPDAFEDEPFQSNGVNMTASSTGDYMTADDAQGICCIKDGYLCLIKHVDVPGIKTDHLGRIKPHPGYL